MCLVHGWKRFGREAGQLGTGGETCGRGAREARGRMMGEREDGNERGDEVPIDHDGLFHVQKRWQRERAQKQRLKFSLWVSPTQLTIRLPELTSLQLLLHTRMTRHSLLPPSLDPFLSPLPFALPTTNQPAPRLQKSQRPCTDRADPVRRWPSVVVRDQGLDLRGRGEGRSSWETARDEEDREGLGFLLGE